MTPNIAGLKLNQVDDVTLKETFNIVYVTVMLHNYLKVIINIRCRL